MSVSWVCRPTTGRLSRLHSLGGLLRGHDRVGYAPDVTRSDPSWQEPVSKCTGMHTELRKPDMSLWRDRSARASVERRVRTCARSSCSGPVHYLRTERTEGMHPFVPTRDSIEIRIP